MSLCKIENFQYEMAPKNIDILLSLLSFSLPTMLVTENQCSAFIFKNAYKLACWHLIFVSLVVLYPPGPLSMNFSNLPFLFKINLTQNDIYHGNLL